MSLSVQQQRCGPDWPLGFIGVANSGNQQGIMSLVDANNIYSPNGPANGAVGSEYTVRCTEILFQAFKPGNNNNGMVPNANNVYICVPAQGNGTGNRSDSGSIIRVLTPGSEWSLTPPTPGTTQLSPYRYSVDADTNGDGLLATLIGPLGN